MFLRRNAVFYLHDVLVKIGTEVFLRRRRRHKTFCPFCPCYPTLCCPCHSAVCPAVLSPCPLPPLHSTVSATLHSVAFITLFCCLDTLCSALHAHHPARGCPCYFALCPTPLVPPHAPPLGSACLCEARHTSSVAGGRRQGFGRTQGRGAWQNGRNGGVTGWRSTGWLKGQRWGR